MEYQCTLCNYIARDNFCLTRHCKSYKHKLKAQEKQIETLEKMKNKQGTSYICDFCNVKYATNSNLQKHKKSCGEKKTLVSSFNTQIKELQMEITLKHAEMEIKTYKEKCQLLSDENKNLKTLSSCNATKANNSISSLNFVKKHYPDAPILKPIKDPQMFLNNLSKKELIENLLSKGCDNVVKYIGDIILKEYKTEDPAQQTLWNTDIDRLNYLVRSLMSQEQPRWKVDKKGIVTTQNIVTPITEYLEEVINEYIQSVDLRSRDIENLNSKSNKLTEILGLINKNNFNSDLLKYLGTHLHVDKEVVLIG